MSYYIIIRGSLGVGKSTIAKLLAQQLQGEYVPIDTVLKENGLDKVEGKCISTENFIKANEIALPKVKEKLAEDTVVIFDGNFYHKEQIEHLIKQLGENHYVFTLKAPLEVCIERDSNRPKAYGKDAATAVYNLVSEFDYGTIIDTIDKTQEEIVREILTYLLK